MGPHLTTIPPSCGCDGISDVCRWNVRFAQALKRPASAARDSSGDKDARTLARELLAGILLLASSAEAATKVVYFASMDRVRWHSVVVFRARRRLQVLVKHARGRLRQVRAEAVVDGTVVCEAERSAVLIDR